MQHSSIWPIDRTLSGAITLGQSGPGRNDNEGILQHSWNLNIRLFNIISRILVEGGGVLPLCRDAAGLFYSPSWLGCFTFCFIIKYKLNVNQNSMVIVVLEASRKCEICISVFNFVYNSRIFNFYVQIYIKRKAPTEF